MTWDVKPLFVLQNNRYIKYQVHLIDYCGATGVGMILYL